MYFTNKATPEENNFHELLDGHWESLSQAARTVIEMANDAACTVSITRYGFDPDNYDRAWNGANLAAAELTDRDRELLAEIWLSALAAAASINPDSAEEVAGYRCSHGAFHQFYRTLSSIVEAILKRLWMEEANRRNAEREPEDSTEDIPF